MSIEDIKNAFEQKFGRRPAGVVTAPGRVNLIGEHTDYNDGFVLPIAIERQTLAAWAPRDDGRVGLASLQQPGQDVELDLCEPLQPGEPAWANYPRGTVDGLMDHGVQLTAVDLLFDSDVPIGGGLSSSASLEVATGTALLAAAGATMDAYELAKLCQAGEHKFPQVPCGIMDQAISALGQAGHALLLDCHNGETRQIPFGDPRFVLLVVDTQVKHELNDGGYAARRKQCESAAKKLELASLRDATAGLIDQASAGNTLDDKERMRAHHVVGEIERTLQAVEALEGGDYDRFGELMYASHASLRDHFEVSCEELDFVVDTARDLHGVFGARMTGGGFGGCAIILASADEAEAIEQAVANAYEAQFAHPCAIFATHAAQGARVLE